MYAGCLESYDDRDKDGLPAFIDRDMSPGDWARAMEELEETDDDEAYNARMKQVCSCLLYTSLKEYMRKGFALDDERLKNLGGGGYFKELLERIRDIRASEKVFYRQVLEIYATSIDYDPKAEISIQFFKKVQNKIHYAIHGQTAAEVIYTRADRCV